MAAGGGAWSTPRAVVWEAKEGVDRRAQLLRKALARIDGGGALQGLAAGVDSRELVAVEGEGMGREGLAPEIDVRCVRQDLAEGVGRVEARDVKGKRFAKVADDKEGVTRGGRCRVEAMCALAIEGVEEDGGGGERDSRGVVERGVESFERGVQARQVSQERGA